MGRDRKTNREQSDFFRQRLRHIKTEIITGVKRQWDEPHNLFPYYFALLYPLHTTKAK